MFGAPAAIVPSPRWLNTEGETSTFRARRLQVAKRPGFGAPRPHFQQLEAEKRGEKPVPGRAGGAGTAPSPAPPHLPSLSSSSRAQESPSCFRTPQISPPKKKITALVASPARPGGGAAKLLTGGGSSCPGRPCPLRRARGEPRGGAEGTQPAAFTPFLLAALLGRRGGSRGQAEEEPQPSRSRRRPPAGSGGGGGGGGGPGSHRPGSSFSSGVLGAGLRPAPPRYSLVRPGHGARLGLRAAAMEAEEEDPELER